MVKDNKKPRERDIYIWNIVGSMANAMFSVVILMFVARSLNKNQADIFSIAWSISQLMVIIGTFQIRTYQATDINGKYNFKQYFYFRIFTITIMMISSMVYVYARGYNTYKMMIIMIMCAIRAVEALSDVYEGWFQQKERLDLAGKSITYKTIITVVVFGIILFVTKDLLLSSIALLVCYLTSFFIYNVRYGSFVEGILNGPKTKLSWKWMSQLLIEGLPIFVNAFLVMSIMNAPKMALDSAIESGLMPDGIQTVFSILFMPASFINLAYIVFRPMITKMAMAWNKGEAKKLFAILVKIEICLLGTSMIILAGSALVGIPILSMIYGMDLTGYVKHLLIIIAGGCFYTFASVFDNALIAMRKHYILIVAYVITWLYVTMVVNRLVIHMGVMGATLAYITSMIVFLLCAIIIFIICFNKEKNREEISK